MMMIVSQSVVVPQTWWWISFLLVFLQVVWRRRGANPSLLILSLSQCATTPTSSLHFRLEQNLINEIQVSKNKIWDSQTAV